MSGKSPKEEPKKPKREPYPTKGPEPTHPIPPPRPTKPPQRMTEAERQARRDAEIDAYTDEIVAQAPPFSAEQKVRLRNILAPSRHDRVA